MVAPVRQEPRRLRSHRPIVRIRQRPPGIDSLAQGIDDRRRVVPLALHREPEDVGQHEFRLVDLLLFRLRDRRHILRRPPPLDDLVRRLAALVELPVPGRVGVGRIEDGMVKKRRRHSAEDISRRGFLPRALLPMGLVSLPIGRASLPSGAPCSLSVVPRSPSGVPCSLSGVPRSHRARLAPYRFGLAPHRARLAPYRLCLAPHRARLAPYRLCLAPHRACLAPCRACLAPCRACLAPIGRASLPIGRASLPVGRASAPIGRALLPIGRGLLPIAHASLPLVRASLPRVAWRSRRRVS